MAVRLIFAGLLLVAVFCLSYDWAVNLLVGVVGAAFGTALGILLSPWSEREEKEFAGFRRVLATFVSGYALAKVDSLVQFVGKEHILDPTTVHRGLLFAGSFLVSMIILFAARRYATPDAKK